MGSIGVRSRAKYVFGLPQSCSDPQVHGGEVTCSDMPPKRHGNDPLSNKMAKGVSSDALVAPSSPLVGGAGDCDSAFLTGV